MLQRCQGGADLYGGVADGAVSDWLSLGYVILLEGNQVGEGKVAKAGTR
jgi:hypothetical protein